MSAPATAARDPRIVRAARLLRSEAARAEERAFVVDGADLLDEARRAGIEVELVFAAEDADVAGDVVRCAPDALRALGALGQPPQVAAVCRMPPPPSGPVPPGALVLVGVGDAGNVGSILRTAAALGLPRVELGAGCADPWSRKALRAALGASFTPGLVHASGRTLDAIAAEPGRARLVAAVPREGREPAALGPRDAVVLGRERDGLTAAEVGWCDDAVSIPAPGFESLNVAAAAAVLGWELVSRTRSPGAGGSG